MTDRTALTPDHVGTSTVDMPALRRVRLVHALLDDEGLPVRLRLPARLRRSLLDHARGLLGLAATGEGKAPADGTTVPPDPDADADAELLALAAEMGLLGEVLRA